MRAKLSATLFCVAMLVLQGCGSMQLGSGDIASNSAVTQLKAVRSSHGLSNLSPDRTLERAALQQARYMAASSRMTHTTGRGRDFKTRMHEHEITLAAENIAYGSMDVSRLFKMWRDSPPHRKNMLDPRFSRFGLASAENAKGVRYWALVLGK